MIALFLFATLSAAAPCGVWPPEAKASDSLDAILAQAELSRAVVVGDTHRMVEPTGLFADLARALVTRGYRVIAFEDQEDRQVFVDQFLAGTADDSALKKTFLTKDERDLIVELKALAARDRDAPPLRVLLIDGPAAWNVSRLEESRDQRMFRHLRDALDVDPRAKVLAFVGNTHTTEGIQLLDIVEGPGHVLEGFRVPSLKVAQYLDLWTGGRSVSVRTVDADEPLGLLVLQHFAVPRIVVPIDASGFAALTGCLDPRGSLNIALRDAPLGVVTDIAVVFRELHQMPNERPRK